jgi:hypothetical protein
MADPRITEARRLLYDATTLIEAFKTGTTGERFTEIADMCTQIRAIRDRLNEIDQEPR